MCPSGRPWGRTQWSAGESEASAEGEKASTNGERAAASAMSLGVAITTEAPNRAQVADVVERREEAVDDQVIREDPAGRHSEAGAPKHRQRFLLAHDITPTRVHKVSK